MGLNWAQWALIGSYALSAIILVATIGQPRKPRSPGEAVFGLLLTAVMVFLVIKAGAA